MKDVVGLINHVQNAYARCIDNGDLEAWPDFFDDDCTYKITTSPAPAANDKSKPAEPIATIMGQAKVIRVNEGRLAGEIFDGAWAPRQYDFADSIKELQKIHGELAYQILFQRDKALSFSRNNLIQEATKVPAQAFEAYMKGSMIAPSDGPLGGSSMTASTSSRVR